MAHLLGVKGTSTDSTNGTDSANGTDFLCSQGSFGRVYHAVWLGTDIAVKVIPDIEGEGLTSVWREIVILRKLRHPNIVLFMAAVEVPSSREVSLSGLRFSGVDDI